MRLFATALLLAVSMCLARAQGQRLQLGIGIMPSFTKDLINNDGNTPKGIEESFERTEGWTLSYSTTLWGAYALNDRSSLIFGLGYQRTASKSDKMTLTHIAPISTPGFTTEPSNATGLELSTVYHNLELPVLFKIWAFERIYAVGGASLVSKISVRRLSWLYENDIVISKRDVDDKENIGYRDIGLNLNVGVGYSFLNASSYSLYAQPYLQYDPLGVYADASLNRHPIAIGLMIGAWLNS